MSAPFTSTDQPEHPTAHPPPPYESLSGRALIERLDYHAKNPDAADALPVYTTYYNAYLPYLAHVVRNTYGYLLDSSEVEDVVDTALVWFYRDGNKATCINAKTDEDCDRQLRTYLGQRTRWIASKMGAPRMGHSFTAADLAEGEVALSRMAAASIPPDVDAESVETSSVRTKQCEFVGSWISKLSLYEQDVMRTNFFDIHPGQRSERLPPGVVQKLAVKYNLTASAIQKTKERLLNQLEKVLPR